MNFDEYIGCRGKIGLLTPVNGTAMEKEFHCYEPEGVATMTQRILFERVDRDGLIDLAERTIAEARILATANPDLLMFGCTTGGLINGKGYDIDLIKRLEDATGIMSTTTSTALLEALSCLGVANMVVVTPYSEEVNLVEKEFLEDNGYKVRDIAGLG